MTDWVLPLALGILGGAIAGALFFGGLWWTARRLATADRPAMLVATSLLVRFVALAAVLVLLALVDPLALVGGVVGLLVARTVLTRGIGSSGAAVAPPEGPGGSWDG